MTKILITWTNGVDDEMDSVDIESEAELFEDILDHEAEMERSQQSCC